MLSERITDLFRLLQCGNTDIARFAGCSPSLISRLKSGLNAPPQSSRTILRLAEGVYRYADYENMLDVLKALCKVEDIRAEVMIPGIIGWLYEERDYVLPNPVVPKSKRTEESRRHSFGERLDKAMTLLEITNGQLAGALNVDVSLVSRYRTGIYHPNRNRSIRERLSDLLLLRAEKLNRGEALSALCGVAPEELSPEVLAEWLYERLDEDAPGMAETLFRSIEHFTPGIGVPTAPPQLPPVREASEYWGTEGLQTAVVRFLTDAAREGGTLMLYSDEPMDWMSGDREYFALWASLMVACVQNGVQIKIIHNVDRIGPEMIAAIQGWFPLYMSGRIEPYLFRATRNARFCHTIFLRPGKAAIRGFFPAGAGEARWYDYITDTTHLDALESGYQAMLSSSASPFLRTYTAGRAEAFWQFCSEHDPGKWKSILIGLSLPTMPEGLLERMLTRAGIDPCQRDTLLKAYRERRSLFLERLAHGCVDEICCLPAPETVNAGGIPLNLGAALIDLPITYTAEEYREHLAAIRTLVNREKNYHLTILPQLPFQNLQVFILKDAVAVLRCREPRTAFVFLNQTLTRSVSDYADSLVKDFMASRFALMQALDALCGSC